jgi:hypothetical protein
MVIIQMIVCLYFRGSYMTNMPSNASQGNKGQPQQGGQSNKPGQQGQQPAPTPGQQNQQSEKPGQGADKS